MRIEQGAQGLFPAGKFTSRQRLEELRAHRQRLVDGLNILQSSSEFDSSLALRSMVEDLVAINAGIERLEAPAPTGGRLTAALWAMRRQAIVAAPMTLAEPTKTPALKYGKQAVRPPEVSLEADRPAPDSPRREVGKLSC